MGRHSWRVVAPLIALVLGVVAFMPTAGGANAEDNTTAVGYDISWPQCEGLKTPVDRPAFAIVGVNGGKAFTVNHCLKAQWDWAKEGELTAAVYINLNYPRSWPADAGSGPAGNCKPGDDWCLAYNFGYNAAAFSLRQAHSLGVQAGFWWLDIETMNYWSSDEDLNIRIIGAAVDYLREQHLGIGAYSTPYQWGEIVGRYAPGLPAWTAGAEGLDQATTRCTARYAFAGGEVAMVQYVEEFDTNYVCPGKAAAAGLGTPRAAASQAAAPEPPVADTGLGLVPQFSTGGSSPKGPIAGAAFRLPLPPAWNGLDQIIGLSIFR